MNKILKLTVFGLGCVSLLYFGLSVSAVSTNGSATPWTREKAEHLAKKTMFGPTPAFVDQLEAAGSASAAINLLFPTTAPSTASFDAEMSALLASTGFDLTSRTSMNKYYQLKLLRNPYEAKQKLALLFYDIWAANQGGDIYYVDLVEQHNLIDELMF